MNVTLPVGIIFGVASVFFNALARVLWKKYPDNPDEGCNSWAIFGYVLRAGSGLAGNVATVLLPITMWNMFPILGIMFAQLLSKLILKTEISSRQYILGAGICGAMGGAIFCASFPEFSGEELLELLSTPQCYISMALQILVTAGLTIYVHITEASDFYYKYVAPVLLAWQMVICDVTISVISTLIFAKSSILQHIIVFLVLALWVATAVFYLTVEQTIMQNTIVIQTELIRVMFRVLLTSVNGMLLFNAKLEQPVAYIMCMSFVIIFMVLYIHAQSIVR